MELKAEVKDLLCAFALQEIERRAGKSFIEEVKEVKAVTTVDDRILQFFTEKGFGFGFNLDSPECSEWGYF